MSVVLEVIQTVIIVAALVIALKKRPKSGLMGPMGPPGVPGPQGVSGPPGGPHTHTYTGPDGTPSVTGESHG